LHCSQLECSLPPKRQPSILANSPFQFSEHQPKTVVSEGAGRTVAIVLVLYSTALTDPPELNPAFRRRRRHRKFAPTRRRQPHQLNQQIQLQAANKRHIVANICNVRNTCRLDLFAKHFSDRRNSLRVVVSQKPQSGTNGSFNLSSERKCLACTIFRGTAVDRPNLILSDPIRRKQRATSITDSGGQGKTKQNKNARTDTTTCNESCVQAEGIVERIEKKDMASWRSWIVASTVVP